VIAAAELATQRRLTSMFIAADEFAVQLRRPTFADDGAGGSVREDAVPLPAAYRARLIPMRDGATPRITSDGEEVVPGYMLMCEHTADVQRWDEFSKDGRDYEVVFVNENQQYQMKAEVIYRGE
jgi:hypothetical protein